jgi:heptosyltransferase-2
MFNILIIKLDASGDVLRTTSILEGLDKHYPSPKHITWITHKKNTPILNFCPLIDEIYDTGFLPTSVKKKKFDVAINFDEDLTACDLLYNVDATNKFGFTNHQYKYAPVNELSEYAYKLTKSDKLKFKLNTKTYPQIIYEMCGITWNGEKYGMRYPPKRNHDYVALNTEVGDKWPTKKWLAWDDLKTKLASSGIPFQEQRKFNTLEEYFDWIAGAKVVVTGDSLGMHAAIALERPTVAIFGPTAQVEIESYGIVDKVFVNDLKCSPCYKSACPYAMECMHGISSDLILNKVLSKWHEQQ